MEETRTGNTKQYKNEALGDDHKHKDQLKKDLTKKEHPPHQKHNPITTKGV